MQQHLLLFSQTVVLILCAFLPHSNSGVPMSRYESMMKLESQNTGLYNDSDKVVILTASNFKELVVEQNRSSLVEFYNAYCGHCQRFAPTYKEIAASVWHWRDLVKVMAIDCAAEENNDICREYEVMSYPTLRYFGLNFKPSENNYGVVIPSQEEDVILAKVAKLAANETGGGEAWPNFSGITQSESNNLFHGLAAEVKFVILMLNSVNSTSLGAKTILNFNRYPQLRIRRITDDHLGEQFQLNATQRLAAIDRNRNIELIPYSESTTKDYKEALERFALWNKLQPKSDEVNPSVPLNSPIAKDPQEPGTSKEKQIIDAVKRHKHFIYQADLEQALRNIVHREIPRIHDIKGESLLALQRFMNVLKRYNPLRSNGRLFIDKLQEYVALNNQEISGKDFKDTVFKLEVELSPIYTSSRFIGCTGSKPNFRGFTCSLWTLFHFLTVQAAVSKESADPLEVLQAVHGLVKHFFGCTDCSQHFQQMAIERKIWDTPTKDEAVLWLWEAHNVVNKRLAGDTTEDPQFPKIQFPTKESCPQCHSASTKDWERTQVLQFLKNIHNPANISPYGTEKFDLDSDVNDVANGSGEKTRRKRMVGNIFSDMDMRMGMLLYGFCIVMMIAAFKMFAFKGYRKKPYPHDFLGKV